MSSHQDTPGPNKPKLKPRQKFRSKSKNRRSISNRSRGNSNRARGSNRNNPSRQFSPLARKRSRHRNRDSDDTHQNNPPAPITSPDTIQTNTNIEPTRGPPIKRQSQRLKSKQKIDYSKTKILGTTYFIYFFYNFEFFFAIQNFKFFFSSTKYFFFQSTKIFFLDFY